VLKLILTLRLLAVALYGFAFFLPAVVAPSGELLLGYELFFQGMVSTLILLSVVLGPSVLPTLKDILALMLLVAPWLANIVFCLSPLIWQRLSQRGRVITMATTAVMMSLYAVQPVALYSGTGTGSGPVALLFGYYVWVAAPILLVLTLASEMICARAFK
jgi:hypothetical protein